MIHPVQTWEYTVCYYYKYFNGVRDNLDILKCGSMTDFRFGLIAPGTIYFTFIKKI